MRLAFDAWNLLPRGEVLTDAQAFRLGNPATRLWDPDPFAELVWRGQIVDAGKDLHWTDTAPRTTTTTAGTYRTVAEWCAMVAARMNAVSSGYSCYQLQGSTNRYRVVIAKASGTFALDDMDSADAALVLYGGFRPQDRAAAASQTGDFAVAHAPNETVTIQLTAGPATLTAQATFIVRPRCSPGGLWVVSLGDSDPPTDATYRLADAADDEIAMVLYEGESVQHSVWSLSLYDPRREDWPETGLANAYHGQVMDTEADPWGVNWEVESFAREPAVAYQTTQLKHGGFVIGERFPREPVRMSLSGNPGMAAAGILDFEEVAAAAGTSSYVYVNYDPTEPCRATGLYWIAETPAVRKLPNAERRGRAALDLVLERVGLR